MIDSEKHWHTAVGG